MSSFSSPYRCLHDVYCKNMSGFCVRERILVKGRPNKYLRSARCFPSFCNATFPRHNSYTGRWFVGWGFWPHKYCVRATFVCAMYGFGGRAVWPNQFGEAYEFYLCALKITNDRIILKIKRIHESNGSLTRTRERMSEPKGKGEMGSFFFFVGFVKEDQCITGVRFMYLICLYV